MPIGYGAVTVLLSIVTAALRASALPVRVAPVSSVMDCSAIMVPWKIEFVRLPKNVLSLGATGQDNLRTPNGREGGPYLEDEDSVHVSLTIERHVTRG
jgi:hypothetical protein